MHNDVRTIAPSQDIAAKNSTAKGAESDRSIDCFQHAAAIEFNINAVRGVPTCQLDLVVRQDPAGKVHLLIQPGRRADKNPRTGRICLDGVG
ncbi:MAG: hypothetical protein AW11_01359 [Candidatus Accumulibacter regalis]|uniref:Uncharacterized protein n=1 Tax=Accumulibacter regalis TaxID=522306 RepID=A0A011PQF1_ACCRE|nr:MAG: hypothetical protein AW11_01359 [Candidatus Accumulibacter regalis]